jgi:hypothetical protein
MLYGVPATWGLEPGACKGRQRVARCKCGRTARLALLHLHVQQVVDDAAAVQDAHQLVARRLQQQPNPALALQGAQRRHAT